MTDRELKELLGSELLHIEKHFDDKVLTPPEKLPLPDFVIAEVEKHFFKEKFDWKLLGYTPKFTFAETYVECELMPNQQLESAGATSIFGYAPLKDNEEVACFIAIMDAGFGVDAIEEIFERGLGYIL